MGAVLAFALAVIGFATALAGLAAAVISLRKLKTTVAGQAATLQRVEVNVDGNLQQLMARNGEVLERVTQLTRSLTDAGVPVPEAAPLAGTAGEG